MAQIEIRPEMCGKVIDDSHFNFHVTCKAKMINAINKVKDGGDLLKTLTHLKFATDKKWIKNSCNDPSVAALLDILEEYKRNEHRPSRAKVLIPLLEYAIGLYASDLFFRERGSWFITRIIDKKDSFAVCRVFEKPECWYPNTRNSGSIQGKEGDFYKLENDPDNIPVIEDEYKKWYGVDVTGDTVIIPPDARERAIAAGKQHMRVHEGIDMK